MGWAEERASEIVEQMRSERPSLTIGRQEEIIAAALQKVVDECAEEAEAQADRVIPELSSSRWRAVGCSDVADWIRTRFPKEEK